MVSKKTLSFMRLDSVKVEAVRQWSPQPAKSLQRLRAASVAANLELARSRDVNLNLIALLQIQRVDNGAGQAHG
jgi:hypothetical protein